MTEGERLMKQKYCGQCQKFKQKTSKYQLQQFHYKLGWNWQTTKLQISWKSKRKAISGDFPPQPRYYLLLGNGTSYNPELIIPQMRTREMWLILKCEFQGKIYQEVLPTTEWSQFAKSNSVSQLSTHTHTLTE